MKLKLVHKKHESGAVLNECDACCMACQDDKQAKVTTRQWVEEFDQVRREVSPEWDAKGRDAYIAEGDVQIMERMREAAK